MDGQEQVLIEQVQRGDRAAFEQIVRRHQGAIYGYLRARLLQPVDADDLTQEVFLRCYLARARFDSSSQMRPWLLGIARNILREHIRKQKRRKEVGWTELCLELEELTPVEHERYEEFVGQLPQCLSNLGQSARQALDMHYAARLRLVQIGEQLKRSEGAVKLLLYRARQALKRCLDGGAGDDDKVTR
jgi:RNA polymerase sigma-70 factor (ECF subfamily)